MPGKFVEDVRIYRCGPHTDGTPIMCSEIGWAKVPFLVAQDATESNNACELDHEFDRADGMAIGWQDPDYSDIHVPLSRLASALRRLGITVSYDHDELTRRLGPAPASD